MNKRWMVVLALATAPAWCSADTSTPTMVKGEAALGATPPLATVSTGIKGQKGRTAKRRHKKSRSKKMAGLDGKARVREEKKGAVAAKAKRQRWVCPMDGYVSDHPGKCPRCGMDLVLERDDSAPAAKP